MIIIGTDYHPSFRGSSMVSGETSSLISTSILHWMILDVTS
jgi:hypothetical protein